MNYDTKYVLYHEEQRTDAVHTLEMTCETLVVDG